MKAGPITPAIALHRTPTLALDIARLGAPTAAVLGRLVALHTRLKARGTRLALVNVGPFAHEVFRVAGLLDLLGVRCAVGGTGGDD